VIDPQAELIVNMSDEEFDSVLPTDRGPPREAGTTPPTPPDPLPKVIDIDFMHSYAWPTVCPSDGNGVVPMLHRVRGLMPHLSHEERELTLGAWGEWLKSKGYGYSAARRILLQPLPETSHSRSAWQSIEELRQEPAREWLVKPLIHQQSLAQAFGPPGSGKTFLALDIGLCVATGTDWHEHRVYSGPVVYVAAEGSQGLARRIDAWLEYHGLTAPGRERFVILAEPVYWMSEESVATFLAELERLKPALVCVDTLSQTLPGADESAAKDMTVFIDGARRVTRTGAALLALHHTGWQTGRERGSSTLRAACDTVLKLSGDAERFRLSCEKQRDAEPFLDLAFRLDTVNESCVLTATGNLSSDRLTPADLFALHRLDAIALPNQATAWSDWEKACTDTGVQTDDWTLGLKVQCISRSQLYVSRKKLLEQRLVEPPNSNRWRVTQLGKDELRVQSESRCRPDEEVDTV
jgi:hypothetical protein